MNGITPRSYSCKDEELAIVCRYSVINLKRDLADFTSYSPKFSDEYVTGYEAKISMAEELVSPQSETAEMKKITDHLSSSMANLLTLVNHLGGYLEMANGSINLSAADFGLSDLRKGINSRDPEKVIDRLKDVNQKVVKYKADLAAQGFTDALQEKLTNAYTVLNADRQAQYQILSNRKVLVQTNIGTLNELYSQLTEVLNIGKILYKGVNPAKQKEYTFTELKKRVRRTSKNNDNANIEQPIAAVSA